MFLRGMSFLFWLVCSGLSSYGVVSSPTQSQCTSTFQVWQPGQDTQRMIRELYLKIDNVTSYTKYQVSDLRAHIANEVNRINNWTFAVDRRVFEMQISRMGEELQEMKYASGSVKIESDLLHTSRRVDDMEKVVYGIRSKLRNMGSVSDSTRKQPLHDTLQRQEGLSDSLGQSLQNRIGDLTAEWVLLKRDVVGLEKEDKRQRKQIKSFINQTSLLQSTVNHISSVNKDLQDKNLELTIKQSEVVARMDQMSQTARDVQNTVELFNTLGKGDLITQLQQSSRKLQHDFDALSTKIAKLDSVNVDVGNSFDSAIQDSNAQPLEETPNLPLSKEEDIILQDPSEEDKEKKKPTKMTTFRDCHDVYRAGFRVSGLYDIHPQTAKYRVPVYCYMANDTGHTLIQRRVDGTINFNRQWMEYQQGFGNPYGEIWAGNELIHQLTNQKRYILRVELWDWEGEQFYAEYKKFWVEGKADHYRLHVGQYRGTAGDSLSYHNQMAFSTEDMDNDLHQRNCAAENKGGWWYNSCFYSHLNGLYHTGWYAHTQSKFADGIAWFTLKDDEFYSVKKVEMTLKPLQL